MNLRHLEAFCRVVDRGSFSMAAEDVGLSQPAVTFQIQALEKELGVTLLDRSARKVVPTESGRIFYRHARQILRQVQQAREEIDELDALLRGRLLIGASTGPGEHILPQMLGKFKANHPGIEIVLRILPTDEIIEQVLAYDLEFGVVGARQDNSKLEFERFVQDTLIVITPPHHPWTTRQIVDMEDLMREPFILQQPGAGVRTMLETGLVKIGLSLSDFNVQMELGLQESIKTAVAAGFGVGILSRFAVRQELAFGTLAEVPVQNLPAFRDEFYLVRNRGRKLSRLTEAFLLFAKESIVAKDPR